MSHFSKGKKNIPKIKFDLTADEVLVLPPSRQPVMHPYADEPEGGIHIECYDYPEVFGEKVRALGERGRPRDLYDVINLYRNDQLPSAAVIHNVLQQKCSYKSIELPTLEDVGGYEEALRQNWEPMLAHQLPALPALEVYWETLPDFFAWLLGEVVAVAAQLESVPGEGEIYRPAYGQLGLHSLNGGSLEIIRFAAGNRLCVDLEYTDEDGNHSSRIIEPYSLRQTQNEDILLHAVRAQDGNPRSYRIDRINSVSITNTVFKPRYEIELSPTGLLPVVPRYSSSAGRVEGSSRRASKLGSARRANTGPTYVYRCPMCDKTFRRKIRNSKLNPHKAKDGWPCSGRTGNYEDTKY
jgi:hypothetical protein